LYKADGDQISVNPLGILQNWRLKEGQVDTFMRVCYYSYYGPTWFMWNVYRFCFGRLRCWCI